MVPFPEEEAKELLQNAEAFLKAVEKMIKTP